MKNLTPSPNYMTSEMLGVGVKKHSPKAMPTHVAEGSFGSRTQPAVVVVAAVVRRPSAPVPSCRGQSGSQACSRRLSWRQRAPRPSFA